MKIYKENDYKSRKQLVDKLIDYIYNSPRSYDGDDYRFENAINILEQYIEINDLEDKDKIKSQLYKFTLRTLMDIENKIKEI